MQVRQCACTVGPFATAIAASTCAVARIRDMATARAIAAANQEIHQARVRTKEARRRAKRREGEGLTLADLRTPEKLLKQPVQWKSVGELGEDTWLKVRP